MFLLNIIVFWFQKNQVENTNFSVKRGVATKRFFYDPVFCKKGKVIVFFGPFFWQILVEVQKHYKNRYFSTFLESKKLKN